jgi:hypothetical protein
LDVENHTPSLNHLRDFTRARVNNRRTHVEQDRKQVTAPPDGRFPSFAYEKFLSGVISFVKDGNRGPALTRAVAEASDRMRPSYEAAAKGMTTVLADLRPTAAARKRPNVVVLDRDGYEMVGVRVHLMFDTSVRRLGAFMYFSEKALTEPELAIMQTAIALAVRQVEPDAVPAIFMVRAGSIRIIDPAVALTAERISFLRSESLAYRDAWRNAA